MSDAGRRPIDLPAPTGARPEPQRIGPSMSFRARLTLGLVIGSLLPLTVFGVVLLATEVIRTGNLDTTLVQVVLFVALLLSGYIYVWRKGALDWSSES